MMVSIDCVGGLVLVSVFMFEVLLLMWLHVCSFLSPFHSSTLDLNMPPSFHFSA